tara:strand:+ start:18148 stop:18942 length:795 start_codon:yes stop_codon:yes gene_type:complete
MNLKNSLLKVKGSIALFVILVLSYFFLSNMSVFIPLSKIFSLSFSMSSLENIFSFVFVHENIYHLIANALTVLGYAILVELALGTIDVIAVFVFSTIISALLFTFFNPSVGLIGSSIGMSGLAAASLILDPKRAVALTIGLFLAVFLITPVIFSSIDSEGQNIQDEKLVIEQQIQEAVEQGDIEQQKVLVQKKIEIQQKETEFDLSKEFAKATPVNNQIHAFGAFFGMLYLMLFRRKRFNKAVRNIFHPHFVDFDKHGLFTEKK